jgi:hypothetical protein
VVPLHAPSKSPPAMRIEMRYLADFIQQFYPMPGFDFQVVYNVHPPNKITEG